MYCQHNSTLQSESRLIVIVYFNLDTPVHLQSDIQMRHVFQFFDRHGIFVLVEPEHRRLDDEQAVLKPNVNVDAFIKFQTISFSNF